MSHNDARTDKTRRAILDACARLFIVDRSVSMTAIAREAGIGRATLHRYFSSRDDLLLATATDDIDRVSAAIADARPNDGPVGAVMRRIAVEFLPIANELRFLAGGDDIWKIPGVADRWISMTSVLEDLVRRGQAEGDLRPDLSAAWVTDLFIGIAWTAADSIADGRLAAHDAADRIVDATLNGAGKRHP